MTRSTRAGRRGLAVIALATFAAALTAGCGAGGQAQTATQVPSVPGANAEVPVPEGGTIMLRNAVVSFAPDYPKGATAPLELQLYNETNKPLRLVEVTSPDGRVLLFTGASPAPAGTASPTPPTTRSPSPTAGRTASPTAGRTASATATATRSAAAGGPVNIEIPARGYVVLSSRSGQFLQIVGLAEPLRIGQTVTLTFRFSNGVALTDVEVPVNTPTSPAPRSPLVFSEGAGHD